jgi:hypothetical protein
MVAAKGENVMKRIIFTLVILMTIILSVAYAYKGGEGWPRSYVLQQNLVKQGRVVGTVTHYFSRNGDRRTITVYNNGNTNDTGLIVGKGAYRYSQMEDTLYLLPFISANPKPFSVPAERLERMPNFVGKVNINGMETYLLRSLVDNNPEMIVSDDYYLPGVINPIKSVFYETDGKTVSEAEEFVGLEYREPTRDELMYRYEGKPVKVAPDPRGRGNGN